MLEKASMIRGFCPCPPSVSLAGADSAPSKTPLNSLRPLSFHVSCGDVEETQHQALARHQQFIISTLLIWALDNRGKADFWQCNKILLAANIGNS